MHVLLTIPGLAAKSGGPAAVVQNLSEHLARSGLRVSVLTGEAREGEPEFLPRDPRVRLVRVPAKGATAAVRSILAQVVEHGSKAVVHDFGIWLPANHAVASACYQVGVPIICSTSGMLAPWALRHKAWKKKIAWWLYQRRDLTRANLLAATSEQEVADVRRLFPKKPIALVPNGVEMPPKPGPPISDLRSPISALRTVLFLGRIYPVKGLMNLVEAWAKVRPDGWRCVIAGPDQAGHQRELEEAIRARNLQDVFSFLGMVQNRQKWALLRSADLFVLPSFTENFGIAAAEALGCGVPVVATKGTPWKELQTHKSGWWIDIGVEPLATALRDATSLPAPLRHEMGERGRRLVEEKYSWPGIGRTMLSVYRWMLGDGLQPACVRLAD